MIYCDGGVIQTKFDLERLRFCQVVTGSLDIELYDVSADFSALFDIRTIQGLSIVLSCLFLFVRCLMLREMTRY